ncbi:hypothetical protein GTF03_12195 [Roseobacter sp. HKCCD7415]|uniref:hypothetical protein n=1 Tax=unclassified Roseobacter TaxID=196798 RepID=UPI001490C730|nr:MULTISPECIES: hypothetical protein [unclassified Roseobacter]NNV47530.1 hypothetical protein [Roseobacter sp. HKCCD6265]NNV69192.1 hypothetical protein [Roseobacter sp. HKCCD8474]NNV86314.1 hypothetical protein [Roseobacter sp. HKCCD8414]NNV94333.1 hypothetical protein [Roseobacter sp. HKCCD8914]NNW11832.1 hypothetical protein [Roseobacter sp. HKCCD8484]NNW20342.1 hypothetical protein [Roseobacter sp. HKCCD7543]NNW41647.1 hypothetical protein [Roseobacter sp. HKCCD8654]NNW45983.1 hypothe
MAGPVSPNPDLMKAPEAKPKAISAAMVKDQSTETDRMRQARPLKNDIRHPLNFPNFDVFRRIMAEKRQLGEAFEALSPNWKPSAIRTRTVPIQTGNDAFLIRPNLKSPLNGHQNRIA